MITDVINNPSRLFDGRVFGRDQFPLPDFI
jgi:hypothetical protein